VHSPGLKSPREVADTRCMGHDETAVIDERTTAETPSPQAGRRKRRLAVAAAAAAVAVMAVGAVAWSAVDGNPASAERSDPATAPSHGSAAASSDAAPSASTVPPETETSHGGSSAGATPPAVAGPSTAQPAPLPAGWESRTFQGVTFAVPPGAEAPDVLDPGNGDAPPSFVWTGPTLGEGTNAQISLWIYPAGQAPTIGAEYQSITVPGADQAHMRTGAMSSEPPLTAVDVHVLAGGRFINLVGMFAGGPAGEQMTRDLIASLSIG
jgi:hypothetical protein